MRTHRYSQVPFDWLLGAVVVMLCCLLAVLLPFWVGGL
jgi:hypothetical protein